MFENPGRDTIGLGVVAFHGHDLHCMQSDLISFVVTIYARAFSVKLRLYEIIIHIFYVCTLRRLPSVLMACQVELTVEHIVLHCVSFTVYKYS